MTTPFQTRAWLCPNCRKINTTDKVKPGECQHCGHVEEDDG